MAVLQRLNQQATFIYSADLLKQLPQDFAERSVRRWLVELIEEGFVEKQGEKRGTQYRAIQPIEPLIVDRKEIFQPESKTVLEQIQKPLYERKPVTYHADWLDAYKPNVTFYIPLEIRRQLLNTGNRTHQDDPAGTYAQQIFNRLLIDLSYHSSRLEGNTYSLLDTERLILKGTNAEDKLNAETVMILNHKEAILYLVDSPIKTDITTTTICTLHYLLSDGLVEACYSGKIRDHSVRVKGSTYIPLNNQTKLQKQLESVLEKASLIKDPYEQSLFLLIHISYLQYFTDVNKRTARLIANLPLIKNNLVSLSFNDIERNDYNSAMKAVYELQNIQPILNLYTYSYLRTCVMYDATVEAIGLDEIRVRYRQQRRELVRDIILNKVVKSSIEKYINKKATQLVKETDRTDFAQDVLEDIKAIDKSRITGLGITLDQLDTWIKLNNAD